MRKILVICRTCGHEEKIEVYTDEEAIRLRIPRVPLRCPKCGSPHVETRD